MLRVAKVPRRSFLILLRVSTPMKNQEVGISTPIKTQTMDYQTGKEDIYDNVKPISRVQG